MKGATVRSLAPRRRDFAVELTAAADLSAQAWDDLAERALDAHPYYARRVVAAHRANGLAPSRLDLVTVRRHGRLVALLPCTQAFDTTGLGRRVAMPFASPFTTATAPLVARDCDRAETLDALVSGLAAYSEGRSWRWPQLAHTTPLGADFLDAMRRAGWACEPIECFERPVLTRRADHAAFLDRHPHAGRLKDLRRRARRLAELGRVTCEAVVGGPALAAAVEQFLVLEWAGWKGAAGSAMLCAPQTAAFARALFAQEQGGGVSGRADLLCLDGVPVAVSLALVHAGTVMLLKTTYDETKRTFAPGLLLEDAIVRAMHATGFADKLDSATQPGSVLESLYRDRESIADLVAVPPGAGVMPVAQRVALARMELRVRADAKKLLQRR